MEAVWPTVCNVVACAPQGQELTATLPTLAAEAGRRLGPVVEVAEIEQLVAMAAYGPREAGPPPKPTRDSVADLWRDAGSRDQALERVLAAGVQLPATASAWAGRWDRAVHAIARILETIIAGSVRWLSEKVDPEDFIPSVREEVRACGRFLAEVLAANRCSLCEPKWEDLKLESLATTLVHCTRHHRLDAWDRVTPLHSFLRRAAEHTTRAGPLESRVNDFRRGMLAKVVGTGQLCAGYVLRCDCGGEVPLSNTCTRCGRAAGVVEPRRWWLWFEGQRRPAGCRRCMDCDRYFFTDGSPCPHGHRRWTKRDFVAWVRERHVAPPTDEAKETVDYDRVAQAIRERFKANDPDGALAHAVFVNGDDLAPAARKLGYDVPSAAFQDAVHRIARTVLDLFPEYEAAETDA